jgi:hypothetical protein
MPTYVLRDGQFVDKAIAGPRHVASSAPAVHSDTMAPLKHMGTGRTLDSKSQFRADTKASGCVEVGTDPAALRDRPPITPRGVHEDVKRALAEVRSR